MLNLALRLLPGEANSKQKRLQRLLYVPGGLYKAVSVLIEAEVVYSRTRLRRQVIQRIGLGKLPARLGILTAPLVFIPGEVNFLNQKQANHLLKRITIGDHNILKEISQPALAKRGKIHYNKKNLCTGGENMSLDLKYFEEMEAKIPKGRVRTRFAPSPTGYMHVGNLRTALYT